MPPSLVVEAWWKGNPSPIQVKCPTSASDTSLQPIATYVAGRYLQLLEVNSDFPYFV